ncbi:acyl-CoA dehydrogenase family protein [Cytobacillus sp. FSL W7-1323]|uniref:acyl-CoA dehydrogenase family protein n=1 Tax=unclassified Cytobacillus TaxID=2675268 RepID=UPI002AFE8BF0|nr:acyl-CoA dehydrogenase family protein [Cytobacillus sp. OWB-43]MEA1852140.1 acyl-CoA dehydrogenase family protein [Cytobacillus sp. OWB-43]
MSEIKEYIYDSASKFLKKQSTQDLLEKGQKGLFDDELWASLNDMGLTGVNIPEAYGGVGGDYEDGFTVIRLVGQYPIPLPLPETLISKWILSQYEMKITHDQPLSFHFNEQNPLEVRKHNGNYILSGEALNVPWGRVAKEIVALAKCQNEWMMVLLPVNESKIHEQVNLAGEPRDSLIFHDIHIGDSAIKIIEDCESKKIVEQLYALAKAAMLAGISERVVQECLSYASERKQFGKNLYRFQAVQQHISLLVGETAACLAAVNNAVEMLQGSYDSLSIMLTKIKVSAVAGDIAMTAHQLHGAIGMTYEHTLHHLTKRLWSWRDEAGNERYWQGELSTYIAHSPVTIWSLLVDNHEVKSIL